MSQIIKANINQRRQILGGELVKNHDFRDFTGKIFPETKLKVVFDDTYHSGEGTGKTLNQDLSGCGNDLTAVNFSANFADELEAGSEIYKNGNILNFNGTSQYMRILAAQAGFTNLNLFTTDYTIEFLSNTTAVGVQTIAAKYENSLNSWILLIASGKIKFASEINNSWKFNVMTNIAHFDGTWHYGAVTINSSGVIIYIDGNPVASTEFIGSPDYSLDMSNNGDFTIGQFNLGLYLNDGLAQIIFHEKDLIADEIKEQYELGANLLWNHSGTIQKDNFKQAVSGGGIVSQAVNTLAGKKYSKLLIKDGAGQSEKAVLGANYDLQMADGTFSKASVREEIYNNTIKANIEKQIIRANIEG